MPLLFVLLGLASARTLQVHEGRRGLGAPASLSLLSTRPAALRVHFGWPKPQASRHKERAEGDKVRAVWASLRQGFDVRAPEEAGAARQMSPRLQRELAAGAGPVAPVSLQSALESRDGTVKLLVELEDGQAVESVILPMGKRTSLCISSQVGCARACRFCSTGTMGLGRNLNTEEILAQVWYAQRIVRERDMAPLVNLVFMGMGEPLDNLPNVAAAVEQLVDPAAFAFSPRNVVVSTVGPSPALIAQAGSLPCRLAWSVHAADDELRRALVPSTRHSMVELRNSFLEALAMKPGGDRTRGLLVGIALLQGINDRAEDAEKLAQLLVPFGRDVLVNLIPYNDNGLGMPGGGLFQTSTLEKVRAFQRNIWDHGILCTVRATRGGDERSACGQLVTARTPPVLPALRRVPQLQMADGSVSGVLYSGPDEAPTVQLFTKAGCTLCDVAKDVLARAAAEVPHTLVAVDITDHDNAAWLAKYKYDIPVLHIDAQYWAKHRITLEETIAALKSAQEGQFETSPGEPDASRLRLK